MIVSGALEANIQTTLNQRDFAPAFPRVLDRVRDRARFVVERNGESFAVLPPPPPEPAPGISGSELVARTGDLKMPGDGFADDIEATRAELRPVPVPRWPG